MPILRHLLQRSAAFLGTTNGEISSQHSARTALRTRAARWRHCTAPWQPVAPAAPSAEGYKACHYSAEVLGSIQGRMFHNIIKQSGRPPALAQAALLHRRHHTTPWRGEFSASTQGRPRNSIKINVQPPGIRLPRRYFSTQAPSRSVSYFWFLCKVTAAAAFINIMWSFVYHTYLVQIPYTSRTPIFQLETVPYTNRIHFVIRSPQDDREYAESCFAFVRKNHSSKFLSPLHPDSVRVNLITAQLLRAVQRGLDIKNRDVALVHESSCKHVSLDARHAIESKKQGKLCKSQSQTAHLDGLAWEVIVVKNDRHVGAMSWPHGKIIVFTGLLNHLQTDAEIATILAHEIAHMVARHSSESIVYKKWFPFPLKVHFIRRMEIEADRMGMLIMAAAGFDPHIAPVVAEKLVGNDIYHPSGKKRARLLSRAKVMDEALELYREVMSAKAPETHPATGA
ncbi:unnamed protein product [Triticum turgidum subsp. durum]|uniref:Peptidase M48 domain-containing protein n=2 Tax=Triticum turgidum subsp. durum TaxID=4567 RepID=A0A9R0SPK5_TRITD|nr:unnamed protein product [Triticum turgidum subsp. durum]